MSDQACGSLGMEVVEIRADLHAPLSAANSLMPRAGSPLCNIYRDVWLETFRQAAERGVRVVLTGQGGDLGFGGVFPFADLFLKGRWLRLANEVSAYRNRVEVDLAWLVRYRILGPAARWLIPRKKVSPPRWLGPALRDHTAQESKEDRFALPGRRDRKRLLRNPRRFAGTASLTEDAAEFGVEVRHPWVDPRVVEMAEGAPSDWTFADGFHKAPIRDALRAELPSEITARAEKVYPDPIFRRALSGPGRAKIDALVESMVAQELGFIESRALQHAVDEYAQGRGSGIFWHALSLEAWLRGFDSEGSL
jgi:asparagine synthase (glutamine-hydrolysing)